MAIAAHGQTRFDGGEVSPLFMGRIDVDRLKASLELCKNWMPTLQGSLERRTGSAIYAAVKVGTKYTRLVPFPRSEGGGVLMEVGENYIRFYSQSNTMVEVVTTYAQDDIASLRFLPSIDVVYVTHPSYPPAKLYYFDLFPFSPIAILKSFVNQNGPWLPVGSPVNVIGGLGASTAGSSVTVGFNSFGNVTGCANNGSGLVRVAIASTASLSTGDKIFITGVVGTVEANGSFYINVIDATHFDLLGSQFVHAYSSGGIVYPYVFDSMDSEGRLIRLEASAVWGWGKITAVASPVSATVLLKSDLGGTTVSAYQLGAWSTANGYPSVATFFENRLYFNGPAAYPQRIDGSYSGDFENFAISAASGTVTAANAVSYDLLAEDVNAVKWMLSDEHGLGSGATLAEWSIRTTDGTGISAVSPPKVVKSTKWGSADVAAVQVGKATMFVQRGGKKIRENHFYFDVDGYRATDLTEIAEHITGTGVVELAYQAVPVPMLWALRNDGVLLGLVYDRDSLSVRAGWSRHVLGGKSDVAGSDPVIESIAVLANANGLYDNLYAVVKRYINGATVRYIEYLTPRFDDNTDQSHGLFLDASISYDRPATEALEIQGVTAANPVSVHYASHGFSEGDLVRFDNVVGMNNADGTNLLNENTFTVHVVDTNHFTLKNANGTGLDGSACTPWVSGELRKKITQFGSTLLSNETVDAIADGIVVKNLVVNNSGLVTLPFAAAVASIGYPYNSDGKLLRTEAGSRNGVALGKTRRTHRIGFMVHRSLGLQVGPSFDKLDPIQFRRQGVDKNGRSVGLFSGLESHTVEFDYDYDNQLCFRVSDPVPCTIQAILPMLETQDRA